MGELSACCLKLILPTWPQLVGVRSGWGMKVIPMKRERERGRKGERMERGREEEVERPKCWLQVYPMLSTAHFALYIDMNMSG